MDGVLQSSAPGASACGDCSAGFACNSVDGSNSPCDAGTYSDGGGVCEICPDGYRCPGGTDRISCPPGSSQPEQGQEECAFCPAGKFQRNENAVSCETCPAGHFCPLGSTSPIECGSSSLSLRDVRGWKVHQTKMHQAVMESSVEAAKRVTTALPALYAAGIR